MAARLSQGTIEEVQRANDIIEVISSYIPLKRSGKDFKACCPFHREKTPSFFVSPGKQIFKCFGCGKGGSVFQFVMARENVTFPEAVRLLAERAGIRIAESADESRDSGEPDRSRIFKTVAWATQVFERFLKQSPVGREYFESRGFTADTVSRFRLGLALDSWDALLQAARKRGIEERLLLAAGLVVQRSDGTGCYDRFRNRVMFPIFDTLNRPIAFGGRALGDDPAKYLNSPDTAVFDKSRNLYGLQVARDGIQSRRQAVVVEGYTDAIMARQVGLENVVATLGTSLTRDHVRLLRRYADEVVLVFDGDLAGQSAADRAVQIFLEEELAVKIVTLPEGLDPCDFLGRGRADEFLKLVAAAPDALEFKWSLVRRQFGEADSVRGRRRAIEAILEAIAAQPVWTERTDSLKRDLLLARMAEVLGIEEQGLRERLTRLIRQARSRPEYEERPEPAAEPDVERADDLRSRAERLVLQVLLASPARIPVIRERLRPADVQTDRHRRLYETLLECEAELASEGVKALWSRLNDESVAALAADLAAEEPSGAEPKSEEQSHKLSVLLEDALATLKRLSEREELAELKDRFAASKTEEERRATLQKMQELRKKSQGFVPPGMAARP